MQRVTSAVFKKLHQPQPGSHKGENGVLYIAAGSKQYHGALQYAIEAASHFVDLIYVETDNSNSALLRALKTVHPALIHVSARRRTQYLKRSDCLLVGPGLGRTASAKRLTQALLQHPYRPAKTVIDADALYFMRSANLTAGTIITPHPGEYRALFGSISPQNWSAKIPAVILAKGEKAVICQNKKCQYNIGGIARYTKGGMGDVLAGLTAAFAATNQPVLAAGAASLLLSLTMQRLQRIYGTSISTLTVAKQLPITLTLKQRNNL